MKCKDVLSKIIQIIMPISLFTIEFLTLISYYKGEYSDDLYYNLRQNWEETPISSIEIEKEINLTSLDKKEYFKFAYYPGFKNEKGNYIIPSRTIYNILGNYFKIKKMPQEYNYPNFILKNNSLQNKKKCGIDSTGNSLYFDSNIECPINFIKIGNKNSISFYDNEMKVIDLGNNISLYYSNKYINNTIITNLQLGLFTPAYKLESNHICDGFSCCGTVNSKEKSIIKQNDSSYQTIYSESISTLLKNNGINNHINVIENNFNTKSFKFWSKTKEIHNNSYSDLYIMDCYSQKDINFNLYYRYYIGMKNLDTKFDKSLISQIIFLPKISRQRNFFEMIVVLLLFIIYNALNVQISKSKFNLGTILALSLILLFSVINIISGIYIIIYHDKIVKDIINKLSDKLLVDSYGNKKKKWFIIFHIIKIIFNSINIFCLILYLIIFIGLRKEFKKHCFTFLCCCRKSKFKNLINPLMEEYEERVNKYEEANDEKFDLQLRIESEEEKKKKLKEKIQEKKDDIDVKISNLGIDNISETVVRNVEKDNINLEKDIQNLEENKEFYNDYIKEYHELSDREKNIEKKYNENLTRKEKLEKELKEINQNKADPKRKAELENEIIELRKKLAEIKRRKK